MSLFLDQPPPAYDVTSTSNNIADASTMLTEAPPPYCLVDPSKIHSTDHLSHYANITPVEIIDVHANQVGQE
jgi:hypothetical protein